jgi:uroporphyrinogen-III synthase
MNGPVVLVLRRDDRFSAILREARFEVINFELIETRPLDDLSELREKLALLDEYDGLLFTSPFAAQVFVEQRMKPNGFDGLVYALGQRASDILISNGLTVKSPQAANTAAELIDEFGETEFSGKRFLFIRGNKSVRTVPERLSKIATIDEVVVYTTDPVSLDETSAADIKVRLSNNEIDWSCFFSPSGVERFSELFGDVAKNAKVAAIGTTTADAARQTGLPVDFISLRSDAEEFARGLIKHIRKSE